MLSLKGRVKRGMEGRKEETVMYGYIARIIEILKRH